MTIPGIGYYSLLIKAEIGDIDRFNDKDRLASYAGLVPRVYASGNYKRYGSITKEGSRWLIRWIMVECVNIHLRYDTPITRAYNRIAEKRGKKIAKITTIRRLLLVCYSVLKNKKPYYNPLHSGNI